MCLPITISPLNVSTPGRTRSLGGLNLGRLGLDAGEDGIELFSLSLSNLDLERAGLAGTVTASESTGTPW